MGRSWEQLLVWQKSHEIVLEVYRLTGNFPPTERYALVDQIRRAAYSIPSNIVEGHSKNSRKDFLRFLYIARGSLEELKYFWLLSRDLGYVRIENYSILTDKLSEISYLLNRLIQSLTSTTSTTSKQYVTG